MTANLEALRARLEELSDLDSAGSLLEWDHQTMMPVSGGKERPSISANLAATCGLAMTSCGSDTHMAISIKPRNTSASSLAAARSRAMAGFSGEQGDPPPGVHRGDPSTVGGDLVAIERADLAFGLGVVFPRKFGGVVNVPASDPGRPRGQSRDGRRGQAWSPRITRLHLHRKSVSGSPVPLVREGSAPH